MHFDITERNGGEYLYNRRIQKSSLQKKIKQSKTKSLGTHKARECKILVRMN